ncbi:unnamed protein product [Cylindrotheca closterium]|uniref:Uncharacterized protein n=1 Tax=Cylindrotheca closterium TaxID=2856 RepID=A0AAD2JNY6_9STRA|nr:unnamed protein product [Cylindrotheca closterium]
MMLGIKVTPEQVLIYGFEMIGDSPTKITDDDFKEHDIGVFKAHFGQRASTLSILWQDILNCTNKDLGLRPSDRSKEGLKQLLVAIHCLSYWDKHTKGPRRQPMALDESSLGTGSKGDQLVGERVQTKELWSRKKIYHE